MSLLLSSTTAPSQPGNLSANAKKRSDGQVPNNSGSFGEVLSRSLAPTGKPSEKTTGKAATPAPARRQPGDHKIDPEDLINAMALSFIPVESRVIKAAPTGGAVSDPDNTASASATAPQPGGAASNPDNTVLLAATVPLTELLVTTPVITDRSMKAKETKETHETNADVDAHPIQGPEIATASQKDVAQVKLNAVVDSSTIPLDPRNIGGQPIAPNTGSPEKSSKRDNRAANEPDDMAALSAESTPAVTHSTAKVIATEEPHSAESSTITVTGSHVPAADTLSASAALPTNLVNTTAPGPVGASTLSSPAVVTTPLLTPEVGSNEWGRALGQQVILMGKAGHQVAELQLNPPGMGPLKVTLSMNDHQIQARFVSEHSSVRAAVEAALPQLRTSLADSGISLGNTSVSAGSQQQAGFTQSQNRQPEHQSYQNNNTENSEEIIAQPLTGTLRRSEGITVDTYA